ncbi:MAG TPA: glycosyltransferase family A protein [Candidatus Babeliales bacterium]|jgi:glycosyltransferase involved in cell wall biosynthesis|nr:glycosyltransferase family A protein [Candidatus Babeliales bacterium]
MTILKSTLFLILHLLLVNINLTLYPYPEKPIVIVIPSYNNQKWYNKNLQSVLSQNYSNFRIMYIDDYSPDGTGDLVEAYLAENDLHHKVHLIKNNNRRGALHNLYTMIYMCEDDEIVVTLDGDDWFPDNEVLNRLNEAYSSEDIWLTYGQFELYPSKIRGWASPMPDYIVENNAFRDFQHLPTHLRTFYAWLFKKIKLQDLLYLGKFYPMTWDMAMMFPMIEMAGERHQFITDIMYIYNDENSLSDHYVSRQLQAYLAQLIKKKNRYRKLTTKPKKQHNITKGADAIIFAQTPRQLTQIIESFNTYVTEIDHIFVMYKPTSAVEADNYALLQRQYQNIKFCLISDHRSNFIEELFNIYQQSSNDYILFSKGDTCIQQPISLYECIVALEETQAYAFYFKLNAHEGIDTYPSLPFVEYRDNIIAWNFALGSHKWSSANSIDFVLHKKTHSLTDVLQSHYDLTPNGLEAVWANEGNLDRLGLCFTENHTVLCS